MVGEEKEVLERCRNLREISCRGLRCTAGGEWRGELQVFESAEAGGGEMNDPRSIHPTPPHPRLWCKKLITETRPKFQFNPSAYFM